MSQELKRGKDEKVELPGGITISLASVDESTQRVKLVVQTPVGVPVTLNDKPVEPVPISG